MTERREYSDEIRTAVTAALMAGNTVNHVAEQFNIPRGTIKFWKAKLPSIPVDPKKEIELQKRLDDLLLGSLDALIVQARVCKDEEWLKEQRASDLAILFGVIADKTIRLLEARQATAEESEETFIDL